jgi:hypothetical protein
MALPSNVVGLMGIDNSGNVVTIPADAFTTSQVSVPSVAAVAIAPPSRATTTNIVTNTSTETIALEIDADENYLVKVNSTRDNFDNSILYESNRKIGLNTKSPQFAFDVNQNSINISNLASNFGYKLNGKNFAFTIGDSTSLKYGNIYLGDKILQTIVVPYLVITKTAITPTPAIIYKRPLYVDDTGLVDAYAAFTEGSIIFSSETQLTQNNTRLFWDNTNFRLGILTNTPAYALDVNGIARIQTSLITPIIGNPTGVTANNTWTFSLNANVPLLPINATHITSKQYTDDNDIYSLTITGATTKTVTITKKDSSTLSATFDIGTGAITGSGTTNYFAKFTGATSIGNSLLYENAGALSYGTTTPFYQLDWKIKSNVQIGFGFGDTFTAGDTAGLVAHGGGGIVNVIPIGFAASTYLFYIGTGEAMRLNGSNNLLIGTTSGVAGGGRLQVNGNVNITGSFQVNGETIGGGGGSGNITGGGTAYNLPLFSTATNIIDSNIREAFGRIGINTAPAGSSSYYLTVAGGINVIGSGAGFFVNGEAIGGGSGGLSGGGTLNKIAKWSGGTSLTDSIISDNGSTVSITGVLSISGQLYVNGSLITGGGGGGGGDTFWAINGAGDGIFYGAKVAIGGNVSSLNKLEVVGSIGASGGYFETSDIRLKNVLSVNPEIDLSQINLIKYTLKDDEKNSIHYGYSAQQVQEVCPDLVNSSDDYLSLNYANVHSAMIHQLQEEVKMLKAKLGM